MMSCAWQSSEVFARPKSARVHAFSRLVETNQKVHNSRKLQKLSFVKHLKHVFLIRCSNFKDIFTLFAM